MARPHHASGQLGHGLGVGGEPALELVEAGEAPFEGGGLALDLDHPFVDPRHPGLHGVEPAVEVAPALVHALPDAAQPHLEDPQEGRGEDAEQSP